MATLTQALVSHAGTQVPFTAAGASGDLVPTGTTLLVTNGAGSPVTVTLAVTATQDGLTLSNRTVNVPAGQTFAIPIVDSLYRNASDGYCHVTYSSNTSVTVAAMRD